MERSRTKLLFFSPHAEPQGTIHSSLLRLTAAHVALSHVRAQESPAVPLCSELPTGANPTAVPGEREWHTPSCHHSTSKQ